MVGIFSRLSATKVVGLFSSSSLEGKDESVHAKDIGNFHVEHGVGLPEEFRTVEHPLEPMENDRPVRCPQPEPCIVHDGQILKERLQLSMQRRHELPFLQESKAHGQQHKWRMTQPECPAASPSATKGNMERHMHATFTGNLKFENFSKVVRPF